jgi:glycosyltransferase involved in cell wall biosynthesis
MKLSILIPTTYSRKEMLAELLEHLKHQIEECGALDTVEVIIDEDGGESSVGSKRQRLLESANGEFVVHIDSDDWVSKDYIESILLATEINPDSIGFEGYMTHDGDRKENFKISKDLPYITTIDGYGNNEYLRFNNHLTPIKREIALKIGFKDMKFAEDYDYALRLKESGLIKTEVYIPKDLYHYRYCSKK